MSIEHYHLGHLVRPFAPRFVLLPITTKSSHYQNSEPQSAVTRRGYARFLTLRRTIKCLLAAPAHHCRSDNRLASDKTAHNCWLGGNANDASRCLHFLAGIHPCFSDLWPDMRALHATEDDSELDRPSLRRLQVLQAQTADYT